MNIGKRIPGQDSLRHQFLTLLGSFQLFRAALQ